MRALHQFVPSLRVGDAVGGHTLRARDVLRRMGFESEIFAESGQPEVAGEFHRIDDYLLHVRRGERGRNGVLYQMATGSRIGEILEGLPERTLLDYHNFTPARFFWGWDDREALRTSVGRAQMVRLAAHVDAALADSSFNASELHDAGYDVTDVVPILLDLSTFDGGADARRLRDLRRARRQGGADLLFVGRFAPNKAHHDLLAAFAAYRRLYDPRARLHLVGGGGVARYLEALRGYAGRLGVADGVHVEVALPHAGLVAEYRNADAFVCLSEHEGFCIPLLESMHHEVPIVAFDATAVPETLGGAGLLLGDKSPAVVAAAIDRIVDDGALRDRMVAAGLARLDDFALSRTTARFEAAVTRFAEMHETAA